MGLIAVKPRRAAGATHSFRLSRSAAHIVDSVPPFLSLEGRPYPRSLGGKSYLVSDAITWAYGGDEGMRPYDLQKRVEFWVARCNTLEEQLEQERQKSEPPMGGQSKIWSRIGPYIRRFFRISE